MTKSELKTGMIVVLANGNEYMVYRDIQTTAYSDCKDAIVAMDGSNSWNKLDCYNENMTYHNRDWNDLDIVKVIQVDHPYAFIRHEYCKDKRKVLWPRKKQYTYAQLKEILGEEFEVIG